MTSGTPEQTEAAHGPSLTLPPVPRAKPEPRQQVLAGVSPVLEVPFHPNGDVDYIGFEHVVDRTFARGVTSVLFPGFASEFYKLSETERDSLLAMLLEQTNGSADRHTIVAVQDHATKLAVARAERAVERGADMINLLPPHFLSPSRQQILHHLQAVMAAVSPTPVVVQFAPTETGTELVARDLHELAARHTNFCAVKVESMPPGALIAELAAGEPPIDGVEGYAGVQLPDAYQRGAVAMQPGCAFTEIYVRIWELFDSGDWDGGFDLHRRLLPYVSFWMLHTERIIAAEKTISMRRGWFLSDHCRAPRYAQDANDVAAIDRFMDEFAEFLG